MEIRFSSLASYKLEKLTEYIKGKWSEKDANKFLLKLDISLNTLKNTPEIASSSTIEKNIRKYVITKQTSLLYEIHNNCIFVLNLIDNRQDPNRIHKK